MSTFVRGNVFHTALKDLVFAGNKILKKEYIAERSSKGSYTLHQGVPRGMHL